MGKVDILKMEDLDNFVKTICSKDIVFWVGAEVDHESSTSLPIGNGLTDFMLQCACGEQYAGKLIKLWNHRKNTITKVLKLDDLMADRPRLETVIESIRLYEEHQTERLSIVKGLRSFCASERPYNIDHVYLAQCLCMGADIVTVNYGDFICEAYRYLYGEDSIWFDKIGHVYNTVEEQAGSIYFIHGVSQEIDTLGASLSTVKDKFPLFFIEKVKEWMDSRYFVFAGYGGVDTLDVNPLLKSLGASYKGKAIYIRHGTYNSEKDVLLEAKEKNLLSFFSERNLCVADTKEVLKIFSRSTYQSHDFDCDSTDWKTSFVKYSDTWTEDMQFSCLLRICLDLGIPIDEAYGATWADKIRDIGNTDDWYRMYMPYQCAAMIQDKEVMKCFEKDMLKMDSSKLMRSDINASNDRIEEAAHKVNIEETIQKVNEKIIKHEIIEWDLSTGLNRYIQNLLIKEIKRVFTLKRNLDKFAEKKRLNEVKECVSHIIDNGYDAVREVNQINTAYRTRGICLVLMGKDASNVVGDFDMALYNYVDISSIDGIISTLIHKSLIYIVSYKRTRNKKEFEEAVRLIKQATYIVDSAKLSIYKERIKRAELLIKIICFC